MAMAIQKFVLKPKSVLKMTLEQEQGQDRHEIEHVGHAKPFHCLTARQWLSGIRADV